MWCLKQGRTRFLLRSSPLSPGWWGSCALWACSETQVRNRSPSAVCLSEWLHLSECYFYIIVCREEERELTHGKQFVFNLEMTQKLCTSLCTPLPAVGYVGTPGFKGGKTDVGWTTVCSAQTPTVEEGENGFRGTVNHLLHSTSSYLSSWKTWLLTNMLVFYFLNSC